LLCVGFPLYKNGVEEQRTPFELTQQPPQRCAATHEEQNHMRELNTALAAALVVMYYFRVIMQ
jgi:hypothetical protein